MKKNNMKNLLFILPCLFLGACAQFSGNASTGEYKGTFFATDLGAGSFTAKGTKLAHMNQSRVPIAAINAASSLGMASIANNGLKALSADHTAIAVGEQGVTKAANAGVQATKQLKITTDGANEALKLAPKP